MKQPFDRISVVGLGYIGLPTAAVIASRGVDVIGVDVNREVVEIINKGRIHIVEPELDVLVNAAVSSGRLKAVSKPERAGAFLIAVPTPFTDGHKPDLSYIESAAKAIAPVLEKGNLVILESTSPVGATEMMLQWLRERRPDLAFPTPGSTKKFDIQVAHCPERVLPGQVLRELVENDRVIGGVTAFCAQRARDLYQIFVRGECVLTDSRTAEMVKLTENAFRDTNIAFANELSLICDKLQINVWELISLANRHPRVKILQPGAGVGGHCIAVDPWFIVATNPEEARLIRTAREVNDSKPQFVIRKVQAKAQKFKNPVIACLGLAFKPDIDDLRESPALEIVAELAHEKVGQVLAVEPNIEHMPEKLKKLGVACVSLEEALERADIVVTLVKHKQFVNCDRDALKEKVVIDVVNAFGER